MEVKPRVPEDAGARKDLPLATGVLDYFPDALLAIAELSRIGNDQHNPGEPLRWERSKSGDEADALLRHLLDRGTVDADGVRHSTKMAWRALALLQKEIEEARGLPVSRGSTALSQVTGTTSSTASLACSRVEARRKSQVARSSRLDEADMGFHTSAPR